MNDFLRKMCCAVMPSIILVIFITPICGTLVGNIANKYYLDKQIFLLEVLHHVQEPLLNRKLLIMGRQLVLDESEYVHYDVHMREFYMVYLEGNLLSRDEFYKPYLTSHYKQTVGLYNFFYNTREWATLRTNICWARQHANPGMFVYALIQVLLKREDYRLLMMPKIYELLPEHFHHERIVRKARNFNYSNWIRHMDIEQVPGTGNASRLSKEAATMTWWQRGVLREEIYETLPKRLLPATIENVRNTSHWSEAMLDVRVFWLPSRYGRDLTPSSYTTDLSYLIEDVDWNAYWYYLNMAVAMSDLKHVEDIQRLREWCYWQLGQLMARYKLERYSRGLDYEKLKYQEEYRPQLVTWTNDRMGVDTKAVSVCIEEYLKYASEVIAIANSESRYTLQNGTTIKLQRDTGHNWQYLLSDVFMYDFNNWKTDLDFGGKPQGLLELTSALRMPNFYFYADSLLKLYRSFRSSHQPSYKIDETPFDVKLHALQVSKLLTYEELADSDLTNLLHNRHFYYNGNFLWQHTLQARQARLKSAPFTLHLDISTAQWQSAIIRVFLTTATDPIEEQPYYQLDTFRADLMPGFNKIERRSTNFFGYADDHISYTELYQYARLAMNDKYRFPMNLTTPACAFPRRLLLPRGTPQGLSMRLLIVATPYTYQSQTGHELECFFTDGITSFDAFPFGYPFERDVSESELFGKHILWKNVRIYHKDYLH